MKLIIEDDEGHKTVIPVVRDEITIGRNDANLVRLPEKNVSRAHGRLLRESGHYYIEDLNSFTGIRVNGEKIDGKHVVHDGDLIQISEYDLILEEAPDERATPMPPAMDTEAQARRMAETATIRLSDLRPAEVEIPAHEVPPEQRARLLGIFGKHRGEELVLDKSPIRLGRSDENDLRIEHPSISRKHLRLHFDKGTWKVMDAESRNGVRVNGEPYAQIGLRHGDVLEVGHLRYAFVEAGRPFQLPPELTPLSSANLAELPTRSGLWVGIGIASVALLAAAIFLILRNRADAEVAQRLRNQRTEKLLAAEEAVAAHRYSEAFQSLDSARRLGASASDLRNLDAVEREAHAEDLHREMETAIAAQDWNRARRLFDVLALTDTYFGAKAIEKTETIKAGSANAHPAAVTPPVQAAAVAPVRPQRARATRAVAAGPRAYDEAEARRLLNEGNQKLGEDVSTAIVLYQQALTLKPGKPVLALIYRSMGIAFTRQGNLEEGAHYYRLYLPLCTNASERTQVQKVLEDYDARRR